MRQAVEGNHPAVACELEVMIRWVEEREEEWARELAGKKKGKNADEEKDVQGTEKEQKQRYYTNCLLA